MSVMHRLLRSALALATVAPVLALGTASTPAQAAETTQVRIGTWNVQVGRSLSDFNGGLVPLMSRSDIVGLQEVDNASGREEAIAEAARQGWSYYRVKPGKQTPILWRSDRFSFVSGRLTQISAARWVGSESPTPSQKARNATVVRLLDKVTGKRISVINVHLVAGAIRGGRPWYNRPRLFALYREGLVNVMKQVVAERSWGTVFVTGDFNSGWVADRKHRLAKLPIRTMAGLGLRSMWAAERPTNGLGTRNDALIDQIWSTVRPTLARVQFDLSGRSDQRPAVAFYPSP